MAESDEFGTRRAGLEASESFLAEVTAFFAVEESFEVAQKVDERDDLKGWEFALKTLDLGGGDNAFSVAPRGCRVGESVFKVETEGCVSGILSSCGILVEMVEGRGLFSGEVNHPDSVHDV